MTDRKLTLRVTKDGGRNFGSAKERDLGELGEYRKRVVSVAVVSDDLPTGLALSSSGELAGTPTVVGEYAFTIRATDASSLYADHPDSIEILEVEQP